MEPFGCETCTGSWASCDLVMPRSSDGGQACVPSVLCLVELLHCSGRSAVTHLPVMDLRPREINRPELLGESVVSWYLNVGLTPKPCS